MATPAPADAALYDRFAGSFLGVAVCDALGAPLEFSERDHYPRVTEMEPVRTFGLPAGSWTDDTSMMLCLAESLAAHGGQVNAQGELERYAKWYRFGHNSVCDRCFDVGNATRSALHDFLATGRTVALSGESSQGNGSLMRAAAVPLAQWRDVEAAAEATGRSSRTTHAHRTCVDACRLYGALVARAVQGGVDKAGLQALAAAWAPRLAEPIAAIARGEFAGKPRAAISSSGFVVHTLEAALWAFFGTASFEEGAVLVANLADDADSVGAVYGGLAGAFYGLAAIPPRWLAALRRRELLDGVLAQLWTVAKAAPPGAAEAPADGADPDGAAGAAAGAGAVPAGPAS